MATVRTSADLVELLQSLEGVFDAPPPDGDPIDILAHGLQCAEVLRARRPDDTGLQLAGLVHDVGHAVGGSDHDHAGVGARAVGSVLGDRVSRLVGLHVAAKRFLAATEPYELSHASAVSLARQGAAMTKDECSAFLADPDAADALELRRADEAAKVVGLRTAGLDVWAPRIHRFAAQISDSRVRTRDEEVGPDHSAHR